MRKGIYGDEFFTICSQNFEIVVERIITQQVLY
jgi:hypothetical protein